MKYIKTYEMIFNQEEFKSSDIVICIDNTNYLKLEIGKKYTVLDRIDSRSIKVRINGSPQICSTRRFLYPEDYKEYLIEKEAEKYNL